MAIIEKNKNGDKAASRSGTSSCSGPSPRPPKPTSSICDDSGWMMVASLGFRNHHVLISVSRGDKRSLQAVSPETGFFFSLLPAPCPPPRPALPGHLPEQHPCVLAGLLVNNSGPTAAATGGEPGRGPAAASPLPAVASLLGPVGEAVHPCQPCQHPERRAPVNFTAGQSVLTF